MEPTASVTWPTGLVQPTRIHVSTSLGAKKSLSSCLSFWATSALIGCTYPKTTGCTFWLDSSSFCWQSCRSLSSWGTVTDLASGCGSGKWEKLTKALDVCTGPNANRFPTTSPSPAWSWLSPGGLWTSFWLDWPTTRTIWSSMGTGFACRDSNPKEADSQAILWLYYYQIKCIKLSLLFVKHKF